MYVKAQAGLEYLMTYGWAMILVATIVGTLVLVIGSPTSTAEEFRISDPAGFLIKGSQLIEDQAVVKLQNITGGEIEIFDLHTSGYSACTLNGQTVSASAITVGSGGEILVECTVTQGGSKTVSVDYADSFGIEQTVTLTGSTDSLPRGPVGETVCDDGQDNDQDGDTDCRDPNCHGQQGTGGVCEYGVEATCDDEFDNDGDTDFDCDDLDCSSAQNCDVGCGNGSCDLGENCGNCRADCLQGSTCIILNEATGKSCQTVCSEGGYACSTFGTDASATNELFFVDAGGCTESDQLDLYSCDQYCFATSCYTTVTAGGSSGEPIVCGDYFASWTYCNCDAGSLEVCDNSVDDDLDGQVDCDDSDCYGVGSCEEGPTCGDGVCDVGEGCESCREDCSCVLNDYCSSSGQCTTYECANECQYPFWCPCPLGTTCSACGCCPVELGKYCGDWTCDPPAETVTVDVGNIVQVTVDSITYDVSIADISDDWVKPKIDSSASYWLQTGQAYRYGTKLLVYVESITGTDSATFILGENATSCPWDCS